LLKLDKVSVVSDDGKKILADINLQVEIGQFVAILGNNGAGKSEVLSAISGMLRPTHGTIRLNNKVINGFSPNKIVKEGISLVPEGRRLFLDQTVEDNLRLGAFTRYFHGSRNVLENEVKELMSRFILLEKHARHLAGTLSGGELQVLAIARALMARPKILMLDEPSLGLAPLIIREIFEIIRQLKDQGLGILLVEQIANYAIHACDYAYLMQQRKIVYQGEKQIFLEKSDLVKAYLA